MYDESLVAPMREELTRHGVSELRTAADVDAALGEKKGTALVVVNSVCGCAAGNARPAVALASQHSVLPQIMTTVFAGQDRDAAQQARSYFSQYQPSSPSIALLKDGEPVFMLQRHQIEGRDAKTIADELINAFDEHCAP